ncbi:MAG: ubiquinone/menaquinone biosynthesis methyltransferase, partial [Candidatus Omnitrophica bacterium]|nr:ubiquinone/menaquinone biosynthesis methyltransferase [Candidatus Omnitrophota bacterium]
APVVPDPKSVEPKGKQVREMFSRIAPTYDLLNRLLSVGIDQRWRTQAVNRLRVPSPSTILDLCGGTGDFSIQLLKRRPTDRVHLADFAFPMLEKARTRLGPTDQSPHGVLCGDALRMPFSDASFDGCLCGFGVRNWADLEAGLREVNRVLRPDGEFVVLDFFQAGESMADKFGRFYCRKVLPTVGQMISGDGRAYRYLAESMDGFCAPDEFEKRVRDCGFELVEQKKFSMGMCWLFHFRKSMELG